MGYRRTYTEILEMWRDWALRKKNADTIMRRSGFKPGAEVGEVPPTPILSLPGAKKACFESGTEFFPAEFSGFAVTPDGRLYAWGVNSGNVFAQSAPTDYFYTPTRIGKGLSQPVLQVAAQTYGNLLLMADGTLRVVGVDPIFGGDAAFDEEGGFRIYPDISDGAQVAAGRWTSVGQQYVLRDDGTVWARGRRTPGISTEFSTTSNWSADLSVFEQMPTGTIGTDVVEISASFASLTLRRDDGEILAWLNGAASPVNLPTPPAGVIKVLSGAWVLTSGGEVYSHPNTSSGAWTQWAGSDYVDLAVGNLFPYAVKDDGTLWTWSSSSTAVAFGTEFDDWTDVYGGKDHAATNPVATRGDGCAYTWGSNSTGSAGVGYAGGTLADPVPLKVTSPALAWPV